MQQVQENLQNEIKARVILESRFQVFADRLGPVIASPTPPPM